MTKLTQRGDEVVASLFVPFIALLALSLVLLVVALFPAVSHAEGPELSFSAVAFPKTTAGTESATREVVVSNQGGAGAWVEKTVLEGRDNTSFRVTGSDCGQLEPDSQCSVWIAFAPGEAGEKQATLRLHLGDGSDVMLPFSALAVSPQLGFHPSAHDFGLRPIHSEAAQTTFQLENEGEAATQVTSLSFAGGNSNGFWVGNSDCYGRWLEPGQTCSVEVDFGPNEVGSFATQLQASSGSSNFSATLSGEGGRPIVEAEPAEFGTATVGAAGATRTIVVHNRGDVAAGFFIGVIAGGDAGSFRLLDENCTGAPLMPVASCVAHVRFTPQGAGVKTARLAFFGEGEGGVMIPLSGEGVNASMTLAPAGYDFAAVVAGTRSAPQSFAVRNVGSTPLDLEEVGILGADLDQFSLSGDDCSWNILAPGGECVVQVRFTPDSAGAKTARLRVGGDAGVFTAALSGLATAPAADPAPAAALAAPYTAVASPPDNAKSRPRRHRHRKFGRGANLAAAKSSKVGRR